MTQLIDPAKDEFDALYPLACTAVARKAGEEHQYPRAASICRKVVDLSRFLSG